VTARREAHVRSAARRRPRESSRGSRKPRAARRRGRGTRPRTRERRGAVGCAVFIAAVTASAPDWPSSTRPRLGVWRTARERRPHVAREQVARPCATCRPARARRHALHSARAENGGPKPAADRRSDCRRHRRCSKTRPRERDRQLAVPASPAAPDAARRGGHSLARPASAIERGPGASLCQRRLVVSSRRDFGRHAWPDTKTRRRA
jgi:hypothetical protein